MTIALLDSQVLGRVLDVRFVAARLSLGLLALLHERPLIFDEQRDRRHLQRAIFADALDQVGGNRDRLGMQLFLHVAFRPNRADMLEVARPRPEGEPVEYVQNSVLLSFFANHDRSLVCIVRTRVAEDSHHYDVTQGFRVYRFDRAGRDLSPNPSPFRRGEQSQREARPQASISRSKAWRSSGSFSSGSSIDLRGARGTVRNFGFSRRLKRPCTKRSSRTASSPI